MNKTIITTVAMFLNCLVSKAVHAQQQQNPVRGYYKAVNEAELAIVDSNYAVAQHKYIEAFGYKSANGDDLVNAFQVSFLLRDTVHARQYYNELVLKGLHPNFFESKNFNIKDIDAPLSFYLKRPVDSLRKVSEATYKSFATQFDRFFEEDQCIRLTEDEAEKRNAENLDKANEKALYDFILLNGFPTFDNMGYWGRYNRSPYMNGICWLISWHRRPEKSILEDMLKEKVLAGAFDPEKYSVLWSGRGEEKYAAVRTKKIFDPEELKRINEARAEIYLEPLEEYYRKLDFMQNDRRFFLVNSFVEGLNQAVTIHQESEPQKKDK